MKKFALIFASIEACNWQCEGSIKFPPPSRILGGSIRLFAIAGLLFCITACNSPEKTAQKLVRDYLKENLKDPSSYQPAKFGQLDSTYSEFVLDEKLIVKEIEPIIEESDRYLNQNNYDKAFDKAEEAAIKRKEMQAKLQADFVPEFIGWSISHTYRAKNGFGALDISTDTFYFDKELTKIIGVTTSQDQ